jgi:hypothetical protein
MWLSTFYLVCCLECLSTYLNTIFDAISEDFIVLCSSLRLRMHPFPFSVGVAGLAAQTLPIVIDYLSSIKHKKDSVITLNGPLGVNSDSVE